MKRLPLALAAAGVTVLIAGAAEARDQLHIVGSSTVYPFSTAVAEEFGKAGKFKTPIVESTGTGGGLKLFCAGVGEGTPDIANASRKIKDGEIETCKSNGVTSITEVPIGYDGIVIANSKKGPAFSITRKELWLALAKEVPQDGKLVPNFYKSWNEVNAALPAEKIEVLGPPPTSGTRDAFIELVMDSGCKGVPEIEAIEDSKAKAGACAAIREDGAYVDAGENDNLIVQKLDANPQAVGIFGYSFLEENTDKLQGANVDGIAPDFDHIVSGEYPVSRTMYFYVKNQHEGVIPGIREFVAEFTSDKAAGEEGYLADKGMIPFPTEKLKEVQMSAGALKPMM
ncbi:phosphate ABC transporter substrate-binding protein (PhoT family) [Dongia mobilis]|uniref:Phosphate ABC transporter substrate-binding protein (PhoT family) n=1 Tax=Dongia mobilis TaxID=578943 RepID=A0A4R6WZ46_9PROT|nr:PstS family phosphate ABC transporter substrate-binding protein [Dongia mobilis]TDQ86317.1 phosphate ABC transporter substrate-binding protein (PhoT family) [Dongia mobilis]